MPATVPKTVFRCACPHCGALEGLVIRAHSLAIECTECSEDVSREALQEIAIDVNRLIRWLDAAERA